RLILRILSLMRGWRWQCFSSCGWRANGGFCGGGRGIETLAGVSRRRFQLHLSTAVLFMITAGLLLGLNVSGKRGKYVIEGPGGPGNWEQDATYLFGWPLQQEHLNEEEAIKYNRFVDGFFPPI